ncbi:MAG: hypothetical protein ACI397_03790 [Paludibacteraceae bacterium]
MKARLSDWLNSLSGKIGDAFYATPLKDEPGWCIIRQKPGKRPKGWKMSDAQAKQVDALRNRQALASAAYRDPEQRARYQAEYEAWLESEHKRGRYTHMYKGKHVRFLWDYIRYQF